MKASQEKEPCIVCNPGKAHPEDYCEVHREQLHRLGHEYEMFFRLVRISRGKDHEAYALMLQGECDPSGRVLVNETDPDNLFLTVLITDSLDLETPLPDFRALKVERSYGDLLRETIEDEIVRSWYGNARACIDLFRIHDVRPLHWDVAEREEQDKQEFPEESGPCDKGGPHSIH